MFRDGRPNNVSSVIPRVRALVVCADSPWGPSERVIRYNSYYRRAVAPSHQISTFRDDRDRSADRFDSVDPIDVRAVKTY